MKLAENKYATRKQRGLWGGKTEEQKQIIALTSTVTSLQNSIKSRKASNKFDKRNKNKNKSDKDKDKKEKSNKKKKNDEKWAWKLVPPKDNGEKTKKFDGRHIIGVLSITHGLYILLRSIIRMTEVLMNLKTRTIIRIMYLLHLPLLRVWRIWRMKNE